MPITVDPFQEAVDRINAQSEKAVAPYRRNFDRGNQTAEDTRAKPLTFADLAGTSPEATTPLPADQYANPATADYARTLAHADPSFAVEGNNALKSALSVADSANNALGEGLLLAGNAGESGLRRSSLFPGAPTVDQAVNALPDKVGPVPVNKPADLAVTFAGQSLPYIFADVLTGGAANAPLIGATIGNQGIEAGKGVASGEMSPQEAALQIGLAVAPVLGPELARLGIRTIPEIHSFLTENPRGAAIVERAKVKLQNEYGGGPVVPGMGEGTPDRPPTPPEQALTPPEAQRAEGPAIPAEAAAAPEPLSDVQIGDWISTQGGLRGQIVGEGTLGGKKNWPAWKVDKGGGEITAVPKDQAEFWHRPEADPLPESIPEPTGGQGGAEPPSPPPTASGAGEPPQEPPRGVTTGAEPPSGETIDDAFKAVGELTAAFRRAEKLRPEQVAMQSLERKRRVAIAASTLERGGSMGKAKAALGGELPKAELQQPAITNEMAQLMREHIARGSWVAPGKFYDRVTADSAFGKIMLGIIPQDSELTALRKAFNSNGSMSGTDLVKAVLDRRSLGAKAFEEFTGALGLPQTFMTSFDLSAPLRQGAVLGSSHPLTWAKTFPKMVRAAAREKDAIAINEAIAKMPWISGDFPGVNLTEGRVSPSAIKSTFAGSETGLHLSDLSNLTEQGMREGAFASLNRSFVSRMAQKFPGIRQSERGFVTMLNKLRADVYAGEAQRMFDSGVRDVAQYEALAKTINHATGWGDFKVGQLTNGVNAFFSPRNFVARFQVVLDPIMQPGSLLKPSARQLAAKNLVAFTAYNAAVLGLIKATGLADVELDPRSTDWGKARIGNTRIDLTAGYGPMIRLAARLAPLAIGEKPQTKDALGNLKPVKPSDLISTFGRGKLGPIPGALYDAFSGQDSPFASDYTSKKSYTALDRSNVFFKNFTPFMIQDVAEAWQTEGPVAAGIAAPTSFFGGGVNTYAPSAKQGIAQKLQTAGIPNRDEAIAAPGWRTYMLDSGFSQVPGADKANTFADLRAAYVAWDAPIAVKNQGISLEVAQKQSSDHFDTLAPIKKFAADEKQARFAFWKAHPDLLVEAADAGVEELNKDERKIYDAYKQAHPVGAK